MRKDFWIVGAMVGLWFCGTLVTAADQTYAERGKAMTEQLQKMFFDEKSEICKAAADGKKPDYIWRQAAAFSVLVAGARHEPAVYLPLLKKHFKGMDVYWDAKSKIPGYEPAPTRGNGNDKYYDDNAWLVITFLEGYHLTHDPAILKRATETAKFVKSAWDDELGGGHWWHERHLDGTKNTCSNGPTAVGYLYLARLGPRSESAEWMDIARKTVEWTQKKLQDKDGLYDDRMVVATGEIKRGKLTYNAALMLRANLDLYRYTGEAKFLEEAKKIGVASEKLAKKETGIYRDPMKWTQFSIEADIDLYRATGEAYLLERAKKNVDYYYDQWMKKPGNEMMVCAGVARLCWLLADLENEKARMFWETLNTMPGK